MTRSRLITSTESRAWWLPRGLYPFSGTKFCVDQQVFIHNNRKPFVQQTPTTTPVQTKPQQTTMRNVSSMAKSSAAPAELCLLTERDKLYLVPVLLPNNNKVAAAAADASAAPVPLCHRPESKSFDKHDQQIRHHQVEIPKSWIPLFPMSPTSTASPSSSSSSTDDSPADRSTAVKTVVIVGRTELLVSVFAQCGCSTNFKSSKGKCYSCQQFLKWSTTSLSRQMLQVRLHSVVVDNNNKTTSTASEIDDETNGECDGTLSVQYFVSHRGISSKVSYTVNSRGQNEDPDPDGNHIPRVSNARDEGEEQPDPLQWSKNPIRLQRGMFVTIRSYGLEDTYYLSAARQNMEEDHGDNGFRRHRHHRQLDLKVVSLADLQPIRKNSRYNDERADSTIEGDAGLRQRAFKHNYKSNRRDHDSMNNEKTEWKIYFCRYGQDLSLRSVNRLTKFLHQHESIHVVDHYKQATHWIVSGTATVAQIAKTMKLPEDRLRNYVETHPSLVCATPQWPERLLKSSMQSLSGPAIDELWYGIDQNKRRKLSQQQEQQQSNEIFSDRPRACNVQISDFFLQLSKLYEQCETEVEDNIRAWKFHKTAGRLTKIDFEIKPDTPLSKIRNIGGFGSEIANMINQIVLTGQVRSHWWIRCICTFILCSLTLIILFSSPDLNQLDRLEEMKQSKRLQAIRDVRAIWGVGKVLSSQLVEKGFTTIEKVRKDLASSTSQLRNLLDWKAKIGGM